jgi:thioredoxin-related protein
MSKKIFLLLMFPLFLNGQNEIKWYSINEAYQAYLKNPKPFYIDVYTEWCGWCKRMDQTTFKDPELANYLNNFFYPIKFDAESKEPVNFGGRTYVNSQFNYGKNLVDSLSKRLDADNLKLQKLNKESEEYTSLLQSINSNMAQIRNLNGKLNRTSHDFAVDLLRGEMSYPTSIFLFDSLRSNMPAKGALSAQQLLGISTFVGENIYKQTRDVNLFQDIFQTALQNKANNLQPIQWRNFEEGLTEVKKNNKKMFLIIDHPSSKSSQTFINAVLYNDKIYPYIQQNFIPTYLSLLDTKNYNFQNQEFKNINGFNQLGVAFLDGYNQFPFVAIIDENENLSLKIQQFIPATDFPNILEYIYTNGYKSTNYADWLKQKEIKAKK